MSRHKTHLQVLAVFVAAALVTSAPRIASANVSLSRSLAAPVAKDAGTSAGICMGDYDNDGWADLCVLNWGGEDNFLYHNNGDGTFTRITDSPIASTGGTSSGGCWGDYDNDGYLDLFVANQQNEHNFLFHNEQDGSFTQVHTGDIVNDYGDSYSAAWADYDNDGWLDLYVANAAQPNFLYHNDGHGNFTRVLDDPSVADAGTTYGIAWGDYDNDGWIDLFVPELGSGPNRLYHNEQGRGFTLAPPNAVTADSSISSSGSWGDYNNDGLLDLFVANGAFLLNPRNNFLYLNLGGGQFERITNSPIHRDSAASMSGYWNDFDHDGDLDLYVTTYVHDDRLYENNGDGTFTEITAGIVVNFGGFTTGMGAADFDFDGDVDMILANWEHQHNAIVTNLTHGNHWLQVDCRGTRSNRFGVGARLDIVWHDNDRRRTATRQITPHFGFRSQSDAIVHFGVNTAETIDTLTIHWPGGNTEVLEGVRTDQRITVRESEGIIATRSPHPTAGLPSVATPVSEAITASGIDRGLKVLDSLCAHHSDQYDCGEANLVGLGYQLLLGGSPHDAKSLFIATAQRNPGSANAWDCVAETCAALQDSTGVVEFSRKVLEVVDTDPRLQPRTRKMLSNTAGYRLKCFARP